MSSHADITRLARRWSAGDDEAFEELVGQVYPELRRLARRQLRARGGATVCTTGLVHEAYLKLADAEGGQWRHRADFFAFCAKVMRHILVDFARRRAAERRGGDLVRVTFSDGIAADDRSLLDIIALDEALERIAKRNLRMARVVECRFFAGLTVSETAEALGTSPRTVEREWTRARAFLAHALSASAS